MTPPSPWPKTFDREQVRSWLEEAMGEGLSVSDALPETLIATAEALALDPVALKIFVYDRARRPDADALRAWAARFGFTRPEG